MNWADIFNQILSIFTSSKAAPVTPAAPAFDGTELELTRDASSALSTQGQLSVNGTWQCYTIECPRVSYQGSHICIPAGTYSITKYFSPDHGFEVPLLDTSALVPVRTSIEMHPSNWAINPDTKQVYLLGCIAMGTSKDQDVVYNSKVAFAALMAKIDWTKPARIVISD